MRTVALLLAVAAAVFAPLAAVAAPAAANFTSFSAFFKGEWEVQLSTAPALAPSAATTVYAPLLSTYTLHSDNVTLNLFGTSFDNNTATAEVTNVQALAVDFTDAAGNVGALSADGKKLFDFNFVVHPNGVAISQGPWLAAKDAKDAKGTAIYTFTALPNDKFVLVVIPAGGEGSAHTFSGSRRVPKADKTFFQQYGTFVMIGVMMVVNMFVQNKTKQMGMQTPPAAGAAPAVAGAPAAPAVAAPAPAAGNKTASKKAD